MKKKIKLRLEIFSLGCMLLIVIYTAIPLFNSSSDAQIIGLTASSFGAGVALSNLVHDRRKEKNKK
jgi:hypothetical protein